MSASAGALPARSSGGPARPVYSVGALAEAIADQLSARFGSVDVSGEISGLTRAASGHWYFTLKDERAQLRCAMFRGRNALVGFVPRDGQQVLVRAQPGVYTPRGELQLIVESMRAAGAGALYERYVQLKAKLEAEGLFDSARKRPLPAVPRCIGIVTSPQAAALRDVLAALARRAPHVRAVLYPAQVQGAQAPAELVAALDAAASRREVDVLLVVRGGGSIEDLWAFNDEQLVRRIAALPLPVVSGVGHETDFTLADFAADLRAPTPTAAAELAARPRDELLAELRALARALHARVERRLLRDAQRIDRAERLLAQAGARLDAEQQRQRQLLLRLQGALRQRLTEARARLRLAATRLAGADDGLASQHARIGVLAQRAQLAMRQRQAQAQAQLDALSRTLEALSPQRTLERGYAVLLDDRGRALTEVQQVRAAERVQAVLADGRVPLQITREAS
jgi:exodeoxyribonuclease VII large subunit